MIRAAYVLAIGLLLGLVGCTQHPDCDALHIPGRYTFEGEQGWVLGRDSKGWARWRPDRRSALDDDFQVACYDLRPARQAGEL